MFARLLTSSVALRQISFLPLRYTECTTNTAVRTASTLPSLLQPRQRSLATLASKNEQHSLLKTADDRPSHTPAQDLFAVVHVGGTQYKISVNDTIVTQKLDADLGSEIYLRKVLLLGAKEFTMVGAPLLDDSLVAVTAVVIEQGKTAKVTVYKKKRRKQYQRERGHRQQVTVLKITDIMLKRDV